MRSYPRTAFVNQFYPKNRSAPLVFTFTFVFSALRFNVLSFSSLCIVSFSSLRSSFHLFVFVFVFASFIIHFLGISFPNSFLAYRLLFYWFRWFFLLRHRHSFRHRHNSRHRLCLRLVPLPLRSPST